MRRGHSPGSPRRHILRESPPPSRRPQPRLKTVPRIGRVLDLVGLLLFLSGAVVYARAWVGFRGVPDFERPERGPVFAAVELADGFKRLQYVGVALMLVGVAGFVLAWWVARRVARARSEV